MAEQNPKPDSQTEPKPDEDSSELPPVYSSSSEEEDEPLPYQPPPFSDSDSQYDSDSDYEPEANVLPGDPQMDIDDEENNTPEANIERFMRVLNSKRMKKAQEEEEKDIEYHEDLFDFPEDKENWKEEDLMELWADAPLGMTKPGWEPDDVDDDEIEVINEMIEKGEEPPIQPFYVPYRKYYPAIPDNHYDIASAKAAVEELDRIEEFLTWVSFIFEDGSSYEGTVWDDLAHGKGVYIGEQGLVRYEGEWLQNNMEGHGIIEVDIPTNQPIPGSKLEAKMRAEGKIIKRDFMDPEDRKWLEMHIEDTVRFFDGEYEIPYYENEEWVKYFGEKPEKGRYRYSGQWKHGRFHGCGVYEVNERVLYGRFYFGQFLEEDKFGCDADITSMHRGLAEVAAAKARMFMYKPDGMVREQSGPYDDPEHPYFYEEDEVWMAPGFINQFYEVPDYWQNYVQLMDEEIGVWLNSFYHAPLRLPMPAELSYWWENEKKEPEFIVIGDDPVPDPEDPSKLIYTDDPQILHTPTGRLINYVDDEEHGIRLYWQPELQEGEELDLSKVDFLPLGFDDFYGRVQTEEKQNFFVKILTNIDNWFKPYFERLENWAIEKKKDNDAKFELLKAEIDLLDAELSLKETIEEMDKELEMMQKEEEKKAEMGIVDKTDLVTPETIDESEKSEAKKAEDEEDEEEEEEEEAIASSFGTVNERDTSGNEQKGKQNGKPPFAASSFSFAASSLASAVPSMVHQSFSKWKEAKLKKQTSKPSFLPMHNFIHLHVDDHASTSVSFPQTLKKGLSLKARGKKHQEVVPITKFHRKKCLKQKDFLEMETYSEECSFNVLSWHTAIPIS